MSKDVDITTATKLGLHLHHLMIFWMIFFVVQAGTTVQYRLHVSFFCFLSVCIFVCMCVFIRSSWELWLRTPLNLKQFWEGLWKTMTFHFKMAFSTFSLTPMSPAYSYITCVLSSPDLPIIRLHSNKKCSHKSIQIGYVCVCEYTQKTKPTLSEIWPLCFLPQFILTPQNDCTILIEKSNDFIKKNTHTQDVISYNFKYFFYYILRCVQHLNLNIGSKWFNEVYLW